MKTPDKTYIYTTISAAAASDPPYFVVGDSYLNVSEALRLAHSVDDPVVTLFEYPTGARITFYINQIVAIAQGAVQ